MDERGNLLDWIIRCFRVSGELFGFLSYGKHKVRCEDFVLDEADVLLLFISDFLMNFRL